MLIYLDNHATTRTDPSVIAAMMPWLESEYANPGSITHEFGREAARKIDEAIESIARGLNASADEIVMTSGATESNNLALFGAALHPRQKRRRIVTLVTEHRAILDPLARLEKLGFEIIRMSVQRYDSTVAGQMDVDELSKVIDEKTALVSIMLANNEIGTIQPIQQIASICRRHGVIVHTDASQAVGKMHIDVQDLDVDLMSFSSHKFYGPKGVGGLYVRQSNEPVRLQPQIYGGGQQHHLRSGTLNTAGIIGTSTALAICNEAMTIETRRVFELRSLLWQLLNEKIDGLQLNGPQWTDDVDDLQAHRLVCNLNVCFPGVDGQSLMLAIPELAASSGSACTAAEPHPSHVLLAIGLSDDQARASLRFGIGRFNTEQEIRLAADWIGQVHRKLVTFAA